VNEVTLVEFECPVCKSHVCEKWGLDGSTDAIRAMYQHAVLNPGLAFNELILGQRSPRNLFVCKSCTVPVPERCYLHCPTCETFLPSMIWSNKYAVKNWIGYVCPECRGEIPCLWNHTSRAILALTAPIWRPRFEKNRQVWLEKQYERSVEAKQNYLTHRPQSKPINYRKMGWFWGVSMNLIFSIFITAILPLYFELNFGQLIGAYFLVVLASTIIWLPAGWFFCESVKRSLDKKGDDKFHLSPNENGSFISSNDSDSTDSTI